MAVDFEAQLPYYADLHDGKGPDLTLDKEYLFGHVQEDIHTVPVRDVRGSESDYELSKHGFEMITLPIKQRITTREEDETTDYAELVDLVKAKTGAKEVLPFGKIFRALPRDGLSPADYKVGITQSPSVTPHLDYSPNAAQFCMTSRNGFTDEHFKGVARWQILGVWRPLKTVQRDPLILSDGRSVPDSDFVDLDRSNTLGISGYKVSLMKCEEKGSHKWYYWSEMAPNEMLLWKHFDSKEDAEVRRCGHTSVAVPGTENLPTRENFEARLLVLY